MFCGKCYLACDVNTHTHTTTTITAANHNLCLFGSGYVFMYYTSSVALKWNTIKKNIVQHCLVRVLMGQECFIYNHLAAKRWYHPLCLIYTTVPLLISI